MEKERLKILCIGDNVVDIYIDQNKYYPGGNALNVAIYARRLGLKSSYMGILGSDEPSKHILKILKAEQIDIQHLRIAEDKCGKAWISHDKYGDRYFVKSNNGGIKNQLRLRFNEDDKKYIREHLLLHTSTYSAIDDCLKDFYGKILLSYDFSLFTF